MTTAAVRGVVRYIGGGPADPPTDADLVNEFARERSEPAFAELLRRHGPVVLGACRRILADPHAAEDAFQAVFLVLARKVGSIRPPGLVGSWLYGVAVRTAKKAKVAEARRWRREMRHFVASRERERPECDAALHAELRAAIDDELAGLPARLRAAVVLCDLGGKSRAEAARELGCPEGTLASRLAKARRILADRLTRRGVAVPLAGVSTLLAPALSAAVPPSLAANTLAAALGAAAASPAASHLAEGVVRTMTANKLKLWAAPLLVLAAVTGGTVLSRGNPPPPRPAPQPAAAPARAPDVTWKEVKTLDTSGWLAGSVAYSPDGKTLVVGGTGRVRAYAADTFKELWTADVDTASQHFAAVAFAFKGGSVLATCSVGVRSIDVANGKLGGDVYREPDSKPTAIGVFPDVVLDVDADPKPVSRKMIFNGENGYHIKSWILWPNVGGINLTLGPKGGPRRPAGETPIAVDPKGKRVVVLGPIDPATGRNVLWAYAAGGGAGNVLMEGHKATVTSAAWSADGRTIVTGDADGTVIVWDAATFKEKSRLRIVGRIVSLALTADGSRTAAAVAAWPHGGWLKPFDQNEVYVWPTATPPARLDPIHHEGSGGPFEGVAGVAFSPDGRSLAAAFANFKLLSMLGRLAGHVRVWSLDEAERKAEPPAAAITGWQPHHEAATLTQHLGPVDSVAFAPDGKSFVSGGADGKVLRWDAATRTPIELGSVIPAGKRTAVAFSPDGNLVAATRDKVTGLFDPVKRQVVLNNPSLPGGRAVAFSPDGKWIGVHDGTRAALRGRANGLAARDTDIPTTIDVPVGDHPAFLAWSPDGAKVALPSPDLVNGGHAIGVHAIGGGKPTVLAGHETPVGAVAWSPDGKRIATGDANGMLFIWDATTMKESTRLRIAGRNGTSAILALAFAPDGVTLAVGVKLDGGKGVHRVILFDAAAGKQGDFLQTGARVRSVAFSPDGRTLLIAHGRDREELKPLMTADEVAASGGIAVWERAR